MWTRDAAEPPCGGKFTSHPSLKESIRSQIFTFALCFCIFNKAQQRQFGVETAQNLIKKTSFVAGGGPDGGRHLPVPGVRSQSGWTGPCIQTLR